MILSDPLRKALEKRKNKILKRIGKSGISRESIADKSYYPFFTEGDEKDFYKNKTAQPYGENR